MRGGRNNAGRGHRVQPERRYVNPRDPLGLEELISAGAQRERHQGRSGGRRPSPTRSSTSGAGQARAAGATGAQPVQGNGRNGRGQGKKINNKKK